MTLRVTCAYCLGQFLTTGTAVSQKMARHGFSIHTQGNGHGHEGAWHSGPCCGTSYPTLDKSTEGTEVALRAVRNRIATVEVLLADLATHPAFVHTVEHTERDQQWNRRVTDTLRCTLVDGDKGVEWHKYSQEWSHTNHYDGQWDPETPNLDPPLAPFDQDDFVIPSYKALLDRKVQHAESELKSLRHTEKVYVEVIATWAPGKYTPVAVEKKGPLVHMSAKPLYSGVLCVRSYSVQGPHRTRTENPDEVTCPRCKAKLDEFKARVATREAAKAVGRPLSY